MIVSGVMAVSWPWKKEKAAAVDARGMGQITGFTKPKKFLFFKIRSKPVYGQAQAPARQAQTPRAAAPQTPAPAQQQAQRAPAPNTQAAAQPAPGEQVQRSSPPQAPRAQYAQVATPAAPKPRPGIKMPAFARRPKPQGAVQAPGAKPTRLQIYFMSNAAKHKDLDAALRAQGIKETPYTFVRKMFTYAMVVSAVVAIALGAVMLEFGVAPAAALVLALALGFACYMALFNRFIRYPLDRSVIVGNEIEKDILFAVRDMVISMRSGMPLFNAITAVSTGYGAASLEFAKVVELVQLGAPIEQAVDEVSERSKSRTFKRMALQTTVSLRAGADIVGALQGVVDEVMQERVIELRRYGQRLNALAMFYMLFGVIFPSMGIAVLAILTTFINIFTVDENTLIFALVGIFFLQVIFLNIMRSSRPTFAM